MNIQLVSEWVHLLRFDYLSAILNPLAMDEAMEKAMLNYGLECVTNLDIDYISFSAHILFDYKLMLVFLNLGV